MPPKRRPGNRDLVPNLYPNPSTSGVVYYRYRDPRTGLFHGMGSDKAAAIKDAKALNAAITAQMASQRVSGIVARPSGMRMSALILRHLEYCEKQHKKGKLAASTLRTKKSLGNTIARAKGDIDVAHFSVTDAMEILEAYLGCENPRERMAQAIRSEGIEIFKTAAAIGVATANPFSTTRGLSVDVQRARLTLESFRLIHAASQRHALPAWCPRSIELAIVTAQRREDVANIEFRPRSGATAWVDGQTLYVVQQKTGTRIAIPLSLRLDALELELSEVLARCRDNVVSRYAVHHSRGNQGSRPGDQVWKDTISRRFADARNAAAADATNPLWEPEKNPPTFHELRSLAERLYNDQGGIDTQVLLGHKDPRSTAIYKDTRGAEWMRVKQS